MAATGAEGPDDFRSRSEKDLLGHAERILQGETASQDVIFRLARALKNKYNRFGAARKLLWLTRSDSDRVKNRNLTSSFQRKLAQQHALCSYKDQDLSVYIRFERALKILRSEDLRDISDAGAIISPETLGIAGATYKAQWEAFGQRAYLYQSLACYQRGWRQQRAADDGYTGINAAFILDLIADQEDADAQSLGAASDAATAKRNEARVIRTELVQNLPAILGNAEKERLSPAKTPDEQEEREDRVYWLLVTLGEALVGLGLDDENRLAAAREFYGRARELHRYDWMVESSARQVTLLMRLLRKDNASPPTPAQRAVIKSLVGETAPGVESAFMGRVGLALSGGGFRASLYHIGVLARLAEVDMLRHIEFLSCVSGGSIIGAYYYLELRKLLQERTDEELRREDYIRLVQSVADKFPVGVAKNIRMLAITDYKTNLAHNLLSGALPTERVAELYETELFSRTGVRPKSGDPGLFLSELFICPVVKDADGNKVQQSNFRPKEGNWRRRHKVPILVLNATTLNTGHNWQFTATWMGEPPSTTNNEIDGNQRLRRLYYSEAPETEEANYQRFRLGRAVGASACVPALFAPVEMPALYEDTEVRLVDGGVHDNQGIASLIDQGCSVVLVSDASGQLGDQADPLSRIAATGLRADEIVQERVRVAQYQDLQSRQRSGLLRSLMFIHLKKDLDKPPKDWLGCPLPYHASEDAKPAAETGPLTSYGVNPDVQRALAAVRTDLDAFHETEAWALMTSGYQMTKFHFPGALLADKEQPQSPADWTFLKALPKMRAARPDSQFFALLQRSSQRFLKAWDFTPEFRKKLMLAGAAGFLVAVGVALLLLWLVWKWPVVVGITVLLLVLFVWAIRRKAKYPLRQHAIAAVLAWGARWYLREKNDRYLESGKWKP